MNSNGSFLPAERQQRILEILREEYTIRGSRLSEMLNVSEMTIRRDLDTLEEKGLVERTHGGAVFRQERVAGKFQYRHSMQENLEEKRQIASRAATLIEPHDTVYIGEGTTAALVVQHIEPGLPCSVFTNNLGAIAESQNPALDLIILGGVYNNATHSLSGPLTMEMLRQINADKVFLGADGLSLSAGMTTSDLDIAMIERQMIRQTRGRVIVMANHTKFGLVADISIVPLRRINILVTNRKVPADFKNDLADMGVEIIITG